MSEWIPIDLADLRLSQRYEITTRDNKVHICFGKEVARHHTLAVREYNPEPYVPPKPTRCEIRNGAGRLMREVLPGDPDPDRVLEVIAEMRKYQSGDLKFWADKLEGKNE
jgi:hypothetical protein